MISTDSAHIGIAFTLAYFSSSDSALTVTAEVMAATTGVSISVPLAKSEALSSVDQFVYVGSYTPSAEGWYFVQYVAKDDSAVTRGSAVSRFHAASATATSSEGESSAGVASGSSETGSSLSVPTVVGGNAGTLTFSTRNV